MEYRLVSEKEYKPAVEIFKKHLAQGSEIECFVGIHGNARICNKNSVMMGLSDSETLFDNCFYPLYIVENVDVVSIIKKNLDQLIESDDLLEIFQAIRLVFAWYSHKTIIWKYTINYRL